MRKTVLIVLCVLFAFPALANEIDDANVAEFNKVTEDVGWPTGLGREAKLVHFTADWTPPADSGKGGGEFFWVVMDTTPLKVKGNVSYLDYIKKFVASYRKNRGKTVKAGSEKIVALVHRDIGTNNYLRWVFWPWLEYKGKAGDWANAKIAGRNYIKPPRYIANIALTAPENVRDFIGAGPQDSAPYLIKLDGNIAYVETMRKADGLCFHRDMGKLAKEIGSQRPFLGNVEVNGESLSEVDYETKGKPFTLTVTPIPEHMPQGWEAD